MNNGFITRPQETVSVKPAQAAELERSDTTISDDSLVENRLTGLLDRDNDYLKSAETRGLQQAQRRGLLASSLSVGETERARIDAALPIAQQDAQLFGQRDLQDSAFNQQGQLNVQNFRNTGSLQDQQSRQNQIIQGQQGRISSTLQSEQGDINSRLQSEQGDINSRLQNEQGVITRQNQHQQFGFNTQLNTQQGNINSRLNAESDERLSAREQASRDHDLTQQGNNTRAQLETNLANNIARIESDPNLSDAQKTQQIQNVTDFHNSQLIAIDRGETIQSNFNTGTGGPRGQGRTESTPEQRRAEYERRRAEILNSGTPGFAGFGGRARRIEELEREYADIL